MDPGDPSSAPPGALLPSAATGEHGGAFSAFLGAGPSLGPLIAAEAHQHPLPLTASAADAGAALLRQMSMQRLGSLSSEDLFSFQLHALQHQAELAAGGGGGGGVAGALSRQPTEQLPPQRQQSVPGASLGDPFGELGSVPDAAGEAPHAQRQLLFSQQQGEAAGEPLPDRCAFLPRCCLAFSHIFPHSCVHARNHQQFTDSLPLLCLISISAWWRSFPVSLRCTCGAPQPLKNVRATQPIHSRPQCLFSPAMPAFASGVVQLGDSDEDSLSPHWVSHTGGGDSCRPPPSPSCPRAAAAGAGGGGVADGHWGVRRRSGWGRRRAGRRHRRGGRRHRSCVRGRSRSVTRRRAEAGTALRDGGAAELAPAAASSLCLPLCYCSRAGRLR